ncbi:uncharacterized protein Dsimw501_GD17384 [Drosophila simulans]|nr:uncharacterized protein Dsimw501_GD17384 [Drosophila simulans]
MGEPLLRLLMLQLHAEHVLSSKLDQLELCCNKMKISAQFLAALMFNLLDEDHFPPEESTPAAKRAGKQAIVSCSPNHGMLRLLEEVVKNVDSYMVQWTKHDDSLRLSQM